MSSWRPGRSPSPPYRSRRYSPSREVSPLPPRPQRNPEDHYRPDTTARPMSMRSEAYPPPPRPRSRSPPRYREERYRNDSPPRRYRSPTPPRPIPAGRRRPGAADFYDDPVPTRDMARSIVADREEIRTREIPPPRQAKVEEQWERGQNVKNYSEYGHGQAQEQHHYQEEYREEDAPRKAGKGPSQPFRDVIFLGLDEELTEDDFVSFLKAEHGADVISVKIVRDRVTGKSKNFGFAQFGSVEDAEDFVVPNFPYITMPALYAHSEAQKVKIDFSTPLGVSNGAGGDYTQPLEPARRHDGTRHIGQPGGGKRVLLFRMLDWHTRGEEIIWRTSQEIARLLNKVGREKEAEGCIVRVATIQDKAGRGASWGFAFVELVTSELAAALLSFLLSPQSQPSGFLISSRPIATSFADPASFEAAEAGVLGGQFSLRATSNGGIGSEVKDKSEGGWCTYANEQAGALETVPGKGQIPEDGILPEINPQLRSFLGNYAGKVDQVEDKVPVAPVGGMININHVMQPIKIGIGFAGISVGKGKKEEAFAGPSRKNLFEDDEDVDEVGKDTVLLSRTKGAHIVPPTSGSRKIAKNISKWNTKQSELASREPSGMGGGVPKGISSANAVLGGPSRSIPVSSSTSQQRPTPVASTSTSPTKPQSPVSPVVDNFDYSDVQASGKVACLLCQRALPSAEVMRKHVLTSDLHKTNLANAITVESGKKRKQAALVKASATPINEEDMPKYRDRAAERREVFNQPEKPHYLDRVALSIPTGPPKRKFAEGPKEPSPPPEPGLAPGIDESNKGNTLLTKMGWAAGTGLGKEKEGRVEPIEVKLLGERAGLGAKR